MRDVAAVAGVGIKTVSRVMNGATTVAPELAARVRDAAAKLGYRPNLLASSLRRSDGRTATIGILVGDVSNPFGAALLRAVDDTARTHGVQVLIGSLDEDPERERHLTRSLVDRKVDGMIIVPTGHDQSYLYAEQQRGNHFVFLDRAPSLFAADLVTSNNRQAARHAVAQLLANGHRRIGYLGDVCTIATTLERYHGYLDALNAVGLPVDLSLVAHGCGSTDIAEAASVAMLTGENPPTALFTSQNLVTYGALKALAGLRLRHQVAHVSFDDIPLADLLDPALSVVGQNTTELGRLATERLFARINGDSSPAQVFTVDATLIARGSGEIPCRQP
jgi:LacI family transcriptional regulator